jgi:OOP family OmpA-OmpF porin
MFKNVLSAFQLVVLLFIPVISQAEIREGSFEVNPFAGYYDMHKADKFGGGIRLGYNITHNWGLEVAYDRAGSTADLYHADILYNFMPERSLTPFIFAGTGLAHVRGIASPYNRALGEVGAGIKYAFNDVIGLRVDVRDMQEKYNDVVATAGLVFTLGGKKQAVSEAQPEAAPAKVEPAPAPKVEEKPAPKAEEPKKAEKVEKERVEFKVLFDFDKSNIKPEYLPEIQKAAEVLKKNPETPAEIQGHTDWTGTKEYNLKLSERRANSVKQALVEQFGIDASRLTTKGFGKSNPVADNRTKEGRQENRRAIVIIYIEQE